LIFKNGILINGLIGGYNGSTIPSNLTSMPNLPVDMVAPSTDFTVDFNALVSNQLEYVIAVPGTDNGYMRKYDGTCGVWEKSSSQAQHTPGRTNGSFVGTSGNVIITASVIKGLAPVPSYLSYKVSGGTASSYPVTVEAYRDFGIIGQLDANDILFDSRVINNGNIGLQNILLVDQSDNVMIVVKSPAGCFDQVLRAYDGFPLPVKLESFTAILIDGKAQLKWTTTSEINLSHFVIEKSTDGSNYTDAGMVFADGNASHKTHYSFSDNINTTQAAVIYYRLRSVDIDGKNKLSDIKSIRIGSQNESGISLVAYPNPVSSVVRITIPSNWQNKIVVYEIFSANGLVVKRFTSTSSSQTETMNLSNLAPGFYLLRAASNGEMAQQKIIKQ
jgi:hypothetical protein